ncbi:Wzz/FepE/Etk N-terminal domain-containing protein [Pseudoflavonifractor sp. An85]|uniref:YveK family protein n=1 Tax=Pseudoflavonifractor sp. An85 TaxID=1965661 RepID=UPI000B3ABC53|nr:Wzz/FepE/Etk N-terminal domain-containing protein [Pseudoflavonifractor sp. An85]OUN22684.1 hypothetical protein B5G37_09755 [Pseudoflavonifractor sp. An85]
MENRMSQQMVEEDVIDLKDIFFILRQKWLKIIAFFVLGAVVAGLVTVFVITPKYTATASIYVVSASNDSVVDLTDLQIGTSLTADYETLLMGRPMMESVIKNLKLEGTTVEDLKSMISISNPTGTRILNIKATSADPQQARDIANEMAKLGVSWLPEVMDSNAPNIAEEAVTPTSPSSPSLVRNIALGALVFAVLYVAFVVVRFMMNDTIRSSEELERYFGIVPLAVVPEADGDARPVSGRPTRKPQTRKAKKGA